jgi:hypothetical protein
LFSTYSTFQSISPTARVRSPRVLPRNGGLQSDTPVLNTHGNRHLTNYNVGAKAIYAVSRDFNLMLETLAGWNEDIAEGVFAFQEVMERCASAIISPSLALPLQLA